MAEEFADWVSLHREAQSCRRCPLANTRHRVVVGEGNPRATLLLVGEAPGAEEDRQGRPFVGAAGQLLDRILAAVGLSRNEVFITNTVQCRPPGNRIPAPEEVRACHPFLKAKFRLLKPRVVVLLGAVATKVVLGDPKASITALRGQVLERDGMRIVPTFHPAALLRDPSKKRPVWEDIQVVRRLYDEALRASVPALGIYDVAQGASGEIPG